MRDVEHVTYFAAGVTRTFCTACTWSVATEHRSLNMQAFEKHICKDTRND